MLLSWLSKLLASLLVPLLFVMTFGLVLNQTVLSSHYIDVQLQHANAYPKLSDAIAEQVVKNSNDANVPAAQLKAQVKTIITPQVLQQKLTSTLNQLEAYYKGNGPVPTIDLSDLIAQAQAAGVPAPKDSNLTRPIQLKAASNAKKVSDKVKAIRLATVAAIVVLALGMVAIAWRRHNYAPLANVFISLGVLLGLLGGALLFAPGIADKYAKLNFKTNAFAGVAHDLGANIARDIGKRLLIIGVLSLVIGIVGRIVIHKLAKRTANTTEKPEKLHQKDATLPPTASSDSPSDTIEPPVNKPKPPKLIQ